MIYKKKGNTIFIFGDNNYAQIKVGFNDNMSSLLVSFHELKSKSDIQYFDNWKNIKSNESIDFISQTQQEQKGLFERVKQEINNDQEKVYKRRGDTLYIFSKDYYIQVQKVVFDTIQSFLIEYKPFKIKTDIQLFYDYEQITPLKGKELVEGIKKKQSSLLKGSKTELSKDKTTTSHEKQRHYYKPNLIQSKV